MNLKNRHYIINLCFFQILNTFDEIFNLSSKMRIQILKYNLLFDLYFVRYKYERKYLFANINLTYKWGFIIYIILDKRWCVLYTVRQISPIIREFLPAEVEGSQSGYLLRPRFSTATCTSWYVLVRYIKQKLLIQNFNEI